MIGQQLETRDLFSVRGFSLKQGVKFSEKTNKFVSQPRRIQQILVNFPIKIQIWAVGSVTFSTKILWEKAEKMIILDEILSKRDHSVRDSKFGCELFKKGGRFYFLRTCKIEEYFWKCKSWFLNFSAIVV